MAAGRIGSLKKPCQNKVNELTAKTLFAIFGLFWSFLATFACKNIVEKSRKDKELLSPHLQFGPLLWGKSEVKKNLSKQGHARIFTIFLTFQIDKSMGMQM